MIFRQHVYDFLTESYKDLPPELAKAGLERNMDWNADLAAEHKQSRLSAEYATYEDLPEEARSVDGEAQVRITLFAEGLHFGFEAAMSVIDSITVATVMTLNSADVEAGQRLINVITSRLNADVAELGQQQGIPDFMIDSLQTTLSEAVTTRIQRTFGIQKVVEN